MELSITRGLSVAALLAALALAALAPAGEAGNQPGITTVSVSGTDVLVAGDDGANRISATRYNADGEAQSWGELHILSDPGTVTFSGPTDTASYEVHEPDGYVIIRPKENSGWKARNLRVSLNGGNDSFRSDALTGNVFLAMGEGDDFVGGEFVNDFTVGGGDDRVIGMLIANGNGFNAGPGDDRVINVQLLPAKEPVRGGPGSDTITAFKDINNAQADLFVGGPGNDRLLGYHGDDTLKGGSGHDVCNGGGNAEGSQVHNGPDRAIGCEVKRGIP